MTYYNLSNVMDANSTLQIVKAVDNDLAGGMLGLLFVIAFIVIMLINYTTNDFRASFLVTMFVGSMVSGLLWIAGLLALYVVIIIMILMFFGIFIFLFE